MPDNVKIDAEKYRWLSFLNGWSFGEKQISAIQSACSAIITEKVTKLDEILKHCAEKGIANAKDIAELAKEVSELKAVINQFKGSVSTWVFLIALIAAVGAFFGGLSFFKG